MEIYYTALLYAFGKIFDGVRDRGWFMANHCKHLAHVVNSKGNPKADVFLLAERCTHFPISKSARPIWAEMARLMLEVMLNDCHDIQVYELHILLLRNPLYNVTIRNARQKSDEVVADDDAVLTRTVHKSGLPN